METRRRIRGVIFSDLGQASEFMALDWVQQALYKSLGFRPYPATLNQRLGSEDEIGAWKAIQREVRAVALPPADGGFCRARLFPVAIDGPAAQGRRKVRGAVLLPEVQGYPTDKVEVIAPMRLKDELQARDGDRLTLEFVH